MKKKVIFLDYSPQSSSDFAAYLKTALHYVASSVGADIFDPHSDIQPGAVIKNVVQEHLHKADLYVAILSADYLAQADFEELCEHSNHLTLVYHKPCLLDCLVTKLGVRLDSLVPPCFANSPAGVVAANNRRQESKVLANLETIIKDTLACRW